MRTALALCIVSILATSLWSPALARRPGHLGRRLLKVALKTDMGKEFLARRRVTKAKRLVQRQPDKALRLIVGTLNSKFVKPTAATATKAYWIANQALVDRLGSWRERARVLYGNKPLNATSVRKLGRELDSTLATMSRLNYYSIHLVGKLANDLADAAIHDRAVMRARIAPPATDHPYFGNRGK